MTFFHARITLLDIESSLSERWRRARGRLRHAAYPAERKYWRGSIPAAIGGNAENISSP
jgi:hypothetical protein